MKEQNYTYDPFQLQNAPTKQKFSFQEKLMAIILVIIFMMIPLYEISTDAFKANYIYVPAISNTCASCYFAENPTIPTQFIQGTQKVE